MSDRTPDMVLQDLRAVRAEIHRGPDALHAADLESEEAALKAQKAEDTQFLQAEGSVDARKAVARLAAETELHDAAVKRAVLNRAKAKIKALELEQGSLQSELRYLMAEGA